MNDSRYPNLYLIGFPKCATTSMFSMLADHPQIFSSGLKKPDYFMKAAFDRAMDEGVPEGELERIRAKSKEYPHQRFDREAYLQDYTGGQDHAYRLDASHYTNFKNVPALIKEVSPDARFIVMMREPVQRFYSHYLMTKRKRRPDIDFAGYLQECLDLEQSRSNWKYNVRTPLAVGLYHEYLLPYIQAFGADRIHPVRFEDFQRDRMETYKAILRFLAVDKDHVPPQFNRSSGGRHRSPFYKKVEDFLLRDSFHSLRKALPTAWRNSFRTAMRTKKVDYEEKMNDAQMEQLRVFYAADQEALNATFHMTPVHATSK